MDKKMDGMDKKMGEIKKDIQELKNALKSTHLMTKKDITQP